MFKTITHSICNLLRSRHAASIKAGDDFDFYVELDEEENSTISANTPVETARDMPFDTKKNVQEELSRFMELRKVLRSFLQKTDTVISDFTALETDDFLSPPNPSANLLTQSAQFKTYAQKRILQLYNLVEETSDYSAVVTSNAHEIVSNSYGIRADYYRDCLVLQLPMLGSRWRKTSVKTKQISSEDAYGTMFQSVILNEIRRLFSQNPDLDPELFREKTLTYFFNHSSRDVHIMDGDNHATKPITDAICSALPGSDSGPTTSFFNATTTYDELPKGTYVVVSPGKHSAQNEDFLKEIPHLFLRETTE